MQSLWSVRAAVALRRYKSVVLLLFSGLYLWATCFRAARKLFWFDELFTLYIARLPDLASVWKVLKQGADLNPPLFYGLVQMSQSVFGEGQVATRLPAILGFWICCLCLFVFVSRRASVLAGLISMLFPLVTTAYFYAYEARPHAIALACGGIALVCWQSAAESKRRTWWLIGLFASLLCGILDHTYAVLLLVPLGLAECTRSVLRKRIDWAVWLPMLCSLLGVLVYVPLLRSMKVGISAAARPSGTVMANSYVFHLGPAVGVLSAALILYFIVKFAAPEPPLASSPAPDRLASLSLPEVVALVGFTAMPLFAFLLARGVDAPLYSRYSISTVIGFSCLFGIMTAQKPRLGLAILFFLAAQISLDLHHYATSDSISEPHIALALSTRAAEFEQIYRRMEELPNKDLPIVLLGNHEFLPILHYAPASLASRLVYVLRPDRDNNGEGCMGLRRILGFPGRCETMANFLAAHDTFLARVTPNSSDRIGDFIRAGADVTMESISDDSFLVSVKFRKPAVESKAALR